MSAGFLRMLSQSPMSMSSGGSTPPIFHELTKILTDEINKQKKQSTTSASADRVVPFIFHLSVSLRKKKKKKKKRTGMDKLGTWQFPDGKCAWRELMMKNSLDCGWNSSNNPVASLRRSCCFAYSSSSRACSPLVALATYWCADAKRPSTAHTDTTHAYKFI